MTGFHEVWIKTCKPHGLAEDSKSNGRVRVMTCLTLYYPVDCSLPCSSVHGVFRARILENSYSRGSTSGDLPDPGIEPSSLVSLPLAGRVFNTVLPGKPFKTQRTIIFSFLYTVNEHLKIFR